MLLRHFVVAYSEDAKALRFQVGCSRTIVRLPILVLVNRSVDFQYQVQLGAEEVDDQAMNHMLATELQTEQTPAAQERPSLSFCTGRVSSKLASAGELLWR